MDGQNRDFHWCGHVFHKKYEYENRTEPKSFFKKMAIVIVVKK